MPNTSITAGPVAPVRYLPAQLLHKVRGPSGPGPLPAALSFVSHHWQLQLPPSQVRLWMPRARNDSKVESHLSHG